MMMRILAAVARAVDFACNLLVIAPFRAIIDAVFPGIFEQAEAAEAEAEAEIAALPDQELFTGREEAAYRRECQIESVRAWAAERLLGGNPRLDESLPDRLQTWLWRLTENELETLISTGADALYAHLFVDMPARGLPPVRTIRTVRRVAPEPASPFLFDFTAEPATAPRP
jgi:hypothetical protein